MLLDVLRSVPAGNLIVRDMTRAGEDVRSIHPPMHILQGFYVIRKEEVNAEFLGNLSQVQ